MFTSAELPVTPYDGNPANFKMFYASLKAAACPKISLCMENRHFAESMTDLNTMLYHWAMGQVDQFTAEIYFLPNKGNGYKALNALCSSPEVMNYGEAEVANSLKALNALSCPGSDLSWFFNRFDVLVKKAGISDDKMIIRHLKKSFKAQSPYFGKLNRLLKDERNTSKPSTCTTSRTCASWRV